MNPDGSTYVRKACAYVTRGEGDLLVFEGPEHDGLQVPKGTVESGESPHEAVSREIREETGIDVLESTRPLVSDVWQRRPSPPTWYVRHFFHVTVHEPRDGWTHTVTGDGDERGFEFEYRWVELPVSRDFALSLDDYVSLLDPRFGSLATTR